MNRLAIALIGLPQTSVEKLAPRLYEIGIVGVEVAPTMVWPEPLAIGAEDARLYARRWNDSGLSISGVQSLLFGQTGLQLLEADTWPRLRRHLVQMIQLGNELGANVAVLGSPRNRRRGDLSVLSAHQIAADFLSSLVPELRDRNVVLTIEPNAPAYGADYLISYSECLDLCSMVDSAWVQPQIDTGCLFMAGQDPVSAVQLAVPHHVHVSSPNLEPMPGPVQHLEFRDSLTQAGYEGWLVLEMRAGREDLSPEDQATAALQNADWFAGMYGKRE